MSTKAIREVLMRLSKNEGDAAVREVEAIERACVVVVREDALEDWTSAGPAELADAIRLIQRIAKEAA